MTLWLELDGVDLAVTGEIVKGYLSMFDRFEVRGVRVRSPAQNVKEILKEGFAKRLTAAALVEAQHPAPIPFPYDVPTVPRAEATDPREHSEPIPGVFWPRPPAKPKEATL